MTVKKLGKNVKKKWRIGEKSAKMKQKKMLITDEDTGIKIGNPAIETVAIGTKTQAQEETGIGEKGNAIEREREIAQGMFIEYICNPSDVGALLLTKRQQPKINQIL